MIVAGEAPDIAGFGKTNPVAAMRAGVKKNANLVIATARNDHRILTHVSREKIPRLGHLAFVCDEEPAARKDLLKLQSVDGIVPEDAPVDEASFEVDQRL